MRADVVAEAGCLVVRVVLEVGGQEADVRQRLEGVAHHASHSAGAFVTSSSSSIMYGDVVSRKARA